MRAFIPELLHSAANRALDLVYPPRCGGCDRRGTLWCDECHRSVTPPPHEADSVRQIDAIVSAGIFDGPLREAIHKLKYEGDTPLTRPLGNLLFEALSRDGLFRLLDGKPPVLAPVPLHARRRSERGFNQSELIARQLASMTGWRVERGLQRVRATRSQVGLNGAQRMENVSGAFAWQGSKPPERVLLVDDVCTTGATLSECAAALRLAGASAVYAATVARAVDTNV